MTTAPRRPIRVLEMRSVRGTGGGPEKTILLGTARTDRARFEITVCYLRDTRDGVFAIDDWARSLGVPYTEINEQHSFDLDAWRELRALVRSQRIDLVHAHEYKTDLLALLLARAEGVIPFATSHGWTGHSWKERRLYYPADRWVLARFPRVVAVSGDIRQRLIEAGARPDRVTTVLNAIDPTAFVRHRDQEAAARAALGLPSAATVFGAVGRLEPQKRFDLLIEAFVPLAHRHPRAHLAIAGDGSLRDDLHARVRATDVADRIHLLGHRSNVKELHHAFDRFVQSSDYEGTPNSVLEAMAMETPIVATDCGGTREIALPGEHAIIVAPGDAEGLRGGMERLLTDEVLARRLAAAARRRVEGELSFEVRMGKVEALYEQLVAERDLRAARA